MATLGLALVLAFGVLAVAPLWGLLGTGSAISHGDHGPAQVVEHDIDKLVQAQAQAYGDADGVVTPPPGATIHILVRQFGFVPSTIRLEKDVDYVLAFHAIDVIHGIALVMDAGIGTVLMPGATVAVPFRAAQEGLVEMLCTEYCGLGHHLMRGQILVRVSGRPEDHAGHH